MRTSTDTELKHKNICCNFNFNTKAIKNSKLRSVN